VPCSFLRARTPRGSGVWRYSGLCRCPRVIMRLASLRHSAGWRRRGVQSRLTPTGVAMLAPSRSMPEAASRGIAYLKVRLWRTGTATTTPSCAGILRATTRTASWRARCCPCLRESPSTGPPSSTSTSALPVYSGASGSTSPTGIAVCLQDTDASSAGSPASSDMCSRSSRGVRVRASVPRACRHWQGRRATQRPRW